MNPITGKFNEALISAGDPLLERGTGIQREDWQEVVHQVLDQGTVVIAERGKNFEHLDIWVNQQKVHSFVAVPLQTRYRHKHYGVPYLHYKHPRTFSPIDRKLLQLFANQTAFLLEEEWLLQRFQEVASIGQEVNLDLLPIP